MLIYENGQTHKNSLPWYQFPAELIIPVKHEHKMRNDDNDEGDESDEVWCDPFRDKLEQKLSQRWPQIFVSETGRAAFVLELSEVDLF